MQSAQHCPEEAVAPEEGNNQCQNPDLAKPSNMDAEPYFQHLFSDLQMHLETRLIIYICIWILPAFSYLGLPTHGLGTRLKVDNIEITLVMMVTMVILKERAPDQLEDIKS